MNQPLSRNEMIQFDPEQGIINFPSQHPGMSMVTEPMKLIYTFHGGKQEILLRNWQPVGGEKKPPELILFQTEIPVIGVIIRLQLKRSENCWKVSLDHQGNQAIHLEKLFLVNQARFERPNSRKETKRDLAFYENGWQSWALSASYSAYQKPHRTHFDRLYPGVWAAAGTPTPRQRGRFGSDFYGVIFDRQSRSGWAAGFLSQHQQFGSVEADLRSEPKLNLWANFDGILLPPGGRQETDWALMMEIEGGSGVSECDPLEEYLLRVARENHARVPASVPVGWCSWYHYFQKVTQEDIRQNLKNAQENRPNWPLDLIQIDDGFEACVGDWHLFHERFPDGVTDLAGEIHEAGFMAGIWLAPFIFQPQSEISQSHPDWMIKDQKGRPRLAGFNWNSRTTALDLTNPEAQDWLRKTIRRAAHDWGFPYLKLDFLYAGGLAGMRKDPTITNAQALMSGLRIIREEAGEDTFLLGCGCPIGSGIGIFDAMRISADTAPSWEAHYFGRSIPILDEPHAPAARNALHNVLTRANLHQKWWWNDPDCILLRPESELTLVEVQTCASVIALTGGMLLVSDDLQVLPMERQNILSQMLPPIQTAGLVLDWLDEHDPSVILWRGEDVCGEYALLGLVNWENRARDLTFDPRRLSEDGSFWLSSFWDGKVVRKTANQEWKFESISAHGMVLSAIRKVDETIPVQYLGSTIHISQGAELKRLDYNETRFRLELDLPRTWDGEIRLWTKKEVKQIETEDATISNWRMDGKILRINLHGKGKGKITGFW